MSEPSIDSYHLTATAVTELATLPINHLLPELTTLGKVAAYTALDDFDQSLRHGGQLLLSTGNTVELIDTDGRTMTQAVQGPVEFAGDIPDGELRRNLKGLSPLRRLLPIGTGLWQRAVLTFRDEKQAVHCRIPMMFLTAEEDQAAAVAVLPETPGYAESLRCVRAQVQELGGSKFNGSALVDGLFPLERPYNAKPGLGFATGASAFDAANSIISTLIPVARANEPGIIADLDTEFLHGYRIQLRKIRSILSLFKKIYDEPEAKHLKAEFSGIMNSTGALRDLDVYLLGKPNFYGMLPNNLHAGLDTLFDMVARHREFEHTKLAALLNSKQYKTKITRLATLFTQPNSSMQGPAADRPASAYAYDLIWNRYRNACKLAAEIKPDSPDDKLHSLRIQCKKLRYQMECLSALFPAAELKKQLGALKKLQDNLGLFNDYSVQQRSLITSLRQLPHKHGAPDIDAAQCIGALIALLHSKQQVERGKIAKSIARFNHEKTQQAFRMLLQPVIF